MAKKKEIESGLEMLSLVVLGLALFDRVLKATPPVNQTWSKSHFWMLLAKNSAPAVEQKLEPNFGYEL